MAVKVSACKTVVRLDFGIGFVTMGLCDSVTPFGKSKSIIDTPDLTCVTSAQVGREEQSTMTFTQFWDPQDAQHNMVDLNFEQSQTDVSKKTIVAHLVTPDYITNAAAAALSKVTYEASVQIVSIAPEELSPDGFYKRTVTLLRQGAITRTVALVV